ncbi:hypothetical protein IP76_04480 [Rhizobium sp. AAP43]|nr:hypothetical protein IP76_04480 [Rhizobium sp. AAP43]
MNSMAALLVIVACHSQDTSCLDEPVSVVSYDSVTQCFMALPKELDQARKLTNIVYGDCVPVDAELVAGKSIRQTINPNRLTAWSSQAAGDDAVNPQAMLPLAQDIPIPLDRYGSLPE